MNADSKASPQFDPNAPIDPARALVPSVVRVNEKLVRRGFWPKLKRVAAHIPFAADALSVWYCARDPATPTSAKAMILAALGYFVLPIDAIPDVLPVIGYTDDAAVIAAVIAILGKNVKIEHRDAAHAALERLKAHD